jgi:hypothetical protein
MNAKQVGQEEGRRKFKSQRRKKTFQFTLKL